MSIKTQIDTAIEGYKSIFNNSMDAVLLTHPDGTIFYANSAAEVLFGYTQNDICKLWKKRHSRYNRSKTLRNAG